MIAQLRERLKGWKTIVWSGFLVVLGLAATVLNSLDSTSMTALLPDKYKPFAPMVLALIGGITESLRWITTTPVGQKS